MFGSIVDIVRLVGKVAAANVCAAPEVLSPVVWDADWMAYGAVSTGSPYRTA